MTMATDDLITILAQSPKPAPRFTVDRILWIWLIATALCTAVILGWRYEIMHLMLNSGIAYKTSLLLGFCLWAGQNLRAAALPLASPLSALPWLALAGVKIVSLGYEFSMVGVDEIFGVFQTKYFYVCILMVSIYGLTGMAILARVLRQYAPANAKVAGGYVALAAASAGAVGYSLHCPIDSPLFILVAYGLPVLVLWAIGRMVLPRYLQW
jgi:hypothetical protein